MGAARRAARHARRRRRVNLARYVFTHRDARTVYADWDAAADEQVARLRAAEPRWGEEPAFVALLEELLAVDEFASRWSTHPVAEKRRGEKRLQHPEVGDLRVAYEVMLLADEEQQLVTWRAADDVERGATRRPAAQHPTRESRAAFGGRQPLGRLTGCGR